MLRLTNPLAATAEYERTIERLKAVAYYAGAESGAGRLAASLDGFRGEFSKILRGVAR